MAARRKRRAVDVEIDVLFCSGCSGHGKTAPGGRPERPQRRAKPTPAELKGKVKFCEPIDVCGQRYRVLVDPDFGPKKIEGSCTYQDNLIELLDQAEDRMHDTLFHEIVHAIADAGALKWTIATRFPKLTKKDRAALDEMLCRFFAPALLATLRSAGWLKLPRKPRT